MADLARLAAVLEAVIVELRGPDADLSWSSFESADAGVAELQDLRHRLAAGDRSGLGTLGVLFAPTGPLQEAAISSGWGDRFCNLADEVDAALAASDIVPPPPAEEDPGAHA